MAASANLEELLRHAGWMRRLAGSLVHDASAAEDLIQDTFESALRHPPQSGPTVRSWLREVLRNALRARLRSDGRRVAREETVVAEPREIRSAEQLVGDVEIQRLLATEVTALEEPYRSTLILRFYEGLSAAEIAARDGIPAGTVRWRLKQALDQLRARLDHRSQGERANWLRALAPLAGRRPRAAAPLVKGAVAMKLGAAAIVLIAAVGATLHHRARATSPHAAAVAPKSAIAPAPAAARLTPAAPHRMDARTRADLLKRLDRLRHAASADAPAPATLDAEYIRQQMKEILPLIKECFENALVTHPNLDGKIVVGFSIVADPTLGGLVTDSQVLDEKSTIADADLRECIQENMYALRFAPPRDGGEVHVEYPFVLKPAPPEDEN